jgi:hypothetical protein
VEQALEIVRRAGLVPRAVTSDDMDATVVTGTREAVR